MRAVVHDRYGPPEVLRVAEVERPAPKEDEVLVRVHASTITRSDTEFRSSEYFFARVFTGLLRPKRKIAGMELAGVVEAVGAAVTEFAIGDEVFGIGWGATAEYVCVREGGVLYVAARDAVARKPANMSFEEAAAVPVAAITALQGLRDKGQLQPGQHVLINGASGGVGTFAVQIAKALGAEVTGVCSTGNVDRARSLGADHVVDYSQEDFTRSGRRYDLLLDVTGTRSWSEYKRVLTPKARLVVVGAPKGTRLLGPLGHVIKLRLAAVGSRRKVVFFIATLNRADLDLLRELMEAGEVTPVIDRRYELSETADAFRYLGEGHARGKIVVTV